MITIAVSKGYLFKDTVKLLSKIGVTFDEDIFSSRLMSFDDHSGAWRLLQVRPSDVPVYVQQGAADLGVVGHDVLTEMNSPLLRLLDLKFGFCRLVIAGSAELKKTGLYPNIRIATKYVNSVEKHCRDKGLKVNLIKLSGGIELAAQTSIADAVGDLTATGKSLKENNLEIIEPIYDSTAHLVANALAFRQHYEAIVQLVDALKSHVDVAQKVSNRD